MHGISHFLIHFSYFLQGCEKYTAKYPAIYSAIEGIVTGELHLVVQNTLFC